MSEKTITAAFLNYKEVLARVAARFVRPGEVEDIVQETYLKTFQADQKKDIKYPKSFMFNIAKNLALDYLKKAENRLNEPYDEHDFEAYIESVTDETYERIEFEERFTLFCKSVRNLPQQCRKAYVLKKVYGLTQKEIAKYMNISEKTVEKHLAQGLLRSNQYLGTVYMQRTGVVKVTKMGWRPKENQS